MQVTGFTWIGLHVVVAVAYVAAGRGEHWKRSGKAHAELDNFHALLDVSSCPCSTTGLHASSPTLHHCLANSEISFPSDMDRAIHGLKVPKYVAETCWGLLEERSARHRYPTQQLQLKYS